MTTLECTPNHTAIPVRHGRVSRRDPTIVKTYVFKIAEL